MFLLSCLLLPMVLATESEVKIHNYVLRIKDNTLDSIEPTGHSEELNLAGLGLRHISNHVFDNLTHIKILSLANNSLSVVPQFIFANLTNLEQLSLADNYIQKYKNTFVGLNNLKHLNISNNPKEELRRHKFFILKRSTINPMDDNAFIDSDVFEKTSHLSKDQSNMNHRSEGHKSLSIKVCKEESKFKLVGIFDSNDTLESNCYPGSYHVGKQELHLNGIGIETFEKGWYQLQEVLIQTINLMNNNITRVTSEMLNDLPPNIVKLILYGNKITRLEKGVIKNEHITALEFSSNNISEIEDDTFADTKIGYLSIRMNRLNNTKFAATLPTFLRILKLNDNEITEISSGSFSKLNRLHSLDLSRNNITEIGAQSLRGLSSLVVLDLKNNQINRIEAGSFQDLNSLEIIVLNNNRIKSTDLWTFADLKNIERVFLAHNDITTLTRDSMIGWSDSLLKLTLNHNGIEKLEAGTFVNVPRVSLLLNKNSISKIESGSFNLPSLDTLNLDGNHISVIDRDLFQGLENLKYLSLEFNAITKIEKGSFRNMTQLSYLCIRNNPINIPENGVLYDFRKAQYCYVDARNALIEF